MKALKRGESRLYLLQVPQSVRRSSLSGVSHRVRRIFRPPPPRVPADLRVNLEGRLAELVTSGDKRGVSIWPSDMQEAAAAAAAASFVRSTGLI